jgi:hypothetical protein
MRTLTTLPPRRPDSPAPSPSTVGRLARMRRAAAELTPQAIEQIAQRVAQLLQHDPHEPRAQTQDPPERLLTATELARRLGVKRPWVYEHAVELGARRLGGGPKARLRFDLEAALASELCSRGGTPAGAAPSPPAEPAPAGHERRRRPPTRPSQPGSVLVVRPRGEVAARGVA